MEAEHNDFGEKLLGDLEARGKAFFLAKSFPTRDPVPPRDFLTGMPGDFGNIMALRPGTGDGPGERDAFAHRQRGKSEKSIEEKHEELKRATLGNAQEAAAKQREEVRRDVTRKFS